MTKLNGTIIFTKAENLKAGDLVISLKSIYKIVDKVANLKEYSLGFASDLESLKQIQIEYEGKFYSLSFSQYALALELGEGAKVEFEIEKVFNSNAKHSNDPFGFEFAKIILPETKEEYCKKCNVFECTCDMKSWEDLFYEYRDYSTDCIRNYISPLTWGRYLDLNYHPPIKKQ